MAKRLIAKKKTKYYVEKDSKGRFMKWTRIGKSLKADRRKKVKTKVKVGYGHKGDLKKTLKKKK